MSTITAPRPADALLPMDKLVAETLTDLKTLSAFYGYTWPTISVRFLPPFPDEVELGGGLVQVDGVYNVIIRIDDDADVLDGVFYLGTVVNHAEAVARLLAAEPELRVYAEDSEIGINWIALRRDKIRQVIAHEVCHALLEVAGVQEDDPHGPQWRELYRRFLIGLGATRGEVVARANEALKNGAPVAA